MYNFIAGRIKGCEAVWIIGDDFVSKSFDQYYKSWSTSPSQATIHNAGRTLYLFENFEVSDFYSNKYVSANQNTISRLRSAFQKGIQDNVILPKYVVIVPDNDIITYFNHTGLGFGKSMGRIINHLMSEYNKLILAQKDFLPTKAKKLLQPQMVWIQLPYHKYFMNNPEREIFNESLMDVVHFHDNTTTLPMKKVWDPEDGNSYADDAQRFTSNGLTKYWMAIDCTLKYMDTICWKKLIGPDSMKKKRFDKDKFTWRSPHFQKQYHSRPSHDRYPQQQHRFNDGDSPRADRRQHYDGGQYDQKKHRLPATDRLGRKLPSPF